MLSGLRPVSNFLKICKKNVRNIDNNTLNAMHKKEQRQPIIGLDIPKIRHSTRPQNLVVALSVLPVSNSYRYIDRICEKLCIMKKM